MKKKFSLLILKFFIQLKDKLVLLTLVNVCKLA
jgi:hypothetical protein